MNFQDTKDELLKWLVPMLLGGIFYSVNELSKEMIAVKTTQAFVLYRVDQHRDTILKHGEDIGELKAAVKVIQQNRIR